MAAVRPSPGATVWNWISAAPLALKITDPWVGLILEQSASALHAFLARLVRLCFPFLASLLFFLSFPQGICFSSRSGAKHRIRASETSKQIPCGNDRKNGRVQAPPTHEKKAPRFGAFFSRDRDLRSTCYVERVLGENTIDYLLDILKEEVVGGSSDANPAVAGTERQCDLIPPSQR